MAMLSLAFLSYVPQGGMVGVLSGTVGGALFGTLAVRGVRSGVFVTDNCLVCRDLLRTRIVRRQEVIDVVPAIVGEKVFVDVWAPRVALAGGDLLDLTPIAEYALGSRVPAKVVERASSISAWCVPGQGVAASPAQGQPDPDE